MLQRIVALAIGARVAGAAQWALARQEFSLLVWPVAPGFYVSMLLGLEGLPGHSPIAAPFQFCFNLAIYSFIVYFLYGQLAKLQTHFQRRAK
jgi:hypothetical protein